MALEHARPGRLNDEAVQARLTTLSSRQGTELNALAGTAPAELSMQAPHRVYTLGLDEVLAGADLATTQPRGWRYLLQQGDQSVAAAETMVDAGGEPAFAQFNSGPFVASTAEALGRAEEYAGGAGDTALEPRLLHVPALHAMALWLHSDDGGADVVLPLRPAPPAVDPDRRYSVEEYLAALRETARTVDPVGPADTTAG